ncbi:hypothetical protein HK104_009275 [Borealophlyctis nickersoniae]|nr:hypothetical protein HK104_009275 [Borealophlyctis nickersoniae]
MSWRQVAHAHIVEALVNNPLFQRFAATTHRKLNEFGSKGAENASQIRNEIQNPEVIEESRERITTFFEVFTKELKEGAGKTLFKK